MEEDNVKNLQIKQEHLIYGLAAALVVIVLLVAALLYFVSQQGTVSGQNESGGNNISLPDGHPPVRDGAVPGPIDPAQMQQLDQQQKGQTQSGEQNNQSGNPAADTPADGSAPVNGAGN